MNNLKNLSEGTKWLGSNKNILERFDLNIEQAMNGASFLDLEKTNSMQVEAVIISAVNEMARLCNSGWTPDETLAAAKIIKAKARTMMKFEEAIYFIQQVTFGKYGKVYGKITLPQIMDFMEIHFQQRNELLDAEEYTRKQQELSWGAERSKKEDRGASLQYFAEKGLINRPKISEEKIMADAKKLEEELKKRTQTNQKTS